MLAVGWRCCSRVRPRPGRGLYVGLDGKLAPQDGTRAAWYFTSPADTTVESFRFWRAVTTTQMGGENTTYDAQEYCTATGGPPQIAARIYRAALTLRDDAAPAFLSPPAGTLTSGGALSGARSISFSAADKGGGIRSATLEVDGAPVDSRDFGCDFTRVVPCKLADGGTLSLDTAKLADGPHSARVLVSDATRTNTTASAPFTFTSANTPTGCAPEASPAFATRFAKGKGTIAYGGKLAVDAAGRFAYKVPKGPSRTLRFAQRVPGSLAYACSAPLTVRVKVSSSLKASPRSIRAGARARFTGRLRGGYVPEGGKLIELQTYERHRWRGITTLRTDARGAFKYRYRFSSRAKGTTFPVRVRVRRDASYPFVLGTSKRVHVRVR
jgi:hypothetical protein